MGLERRKERDMVAERLGEKANRGCQIRLSIKGASEAKSGAAVEVALLAMGARRWETWPRQRRKSVVSDHEAAAKVVESQSGEMQQAQLASCAGAQMSGVPF